MRRPSYNVGDVIVLKASKTLPVNSDKICRIAGVLPNDHGNWQYRVQFDSENFERRITETDIDKDESAPGSVMPEAAKPSGPTPWLRPSSMKIGK